jgi:tetratricopeptide (TPR) repeat protein
VASGLEALAAAQLKLGKETDALSSLDTALEIVQQIGYRAGEAAVLMRFADTFRVLGRLDDARANGVRALELLWSIQRPVLEAEASNVLGRINFDLSEYTVALSQHTSALELANRTHCRLQSARALEGIGNVLAQVGDAEGAHEHWQTALDHHVAMGTPEATELRTRLRSVSAR